MYLIPVPALADNYLWLLHDGKHALVVYPAAVGPVRAKRNQHGLDLKSILVTHRHTALVMPLRLKKQHVISGTTDHTISTRTHKYISTYLRLPVSAKPDNLRLAFNRHISQLVTA